MQTITAEGEYNGRHDFLLCEMFDETSVSKVKDPDVQVCLIRGVIRGRSHLHCAVGL